MINDKTTTYRLKFFFDYQCQSCLWCDNDASYEKFVLVPIEATFYDKDGKILREPKIKLPKELKDKVSYLSSLFDSSLNWENPNEPEPTWAMEKQKEFELKSKELHREICEFLGDDYEIVYKQ